MTRLLLAIAVLAVSCGTTAGGCCKVCSSGKACGDSCISKTASCSKAGGCVCLESELEEIDDLEADAETGAQ